MSHVSPPPKQERKKKKIRMGIIPALQPSPAYGIDCILLLLRYNYWVNY